MVWLYYIGNNHAFDQREVIFQTNISVIIELFKAGVKLYCDAYEVI